MCHKTHYRQIIYLFFVAFQTPCKSYVPTNNEELNNDTFLRLSTIYFKYAMCICVMTCLLKVRNAHSKGIGLDEGLIVKQTKMKINQLNIKTKRFRTVEKL